MRELTEKVQRCPLKGNEGNCTLEIEGDSSKKEWFKEILERAIDNMGGCPDKEKNLGFLRCNLYKGHFEEYDNGT